MMFQLWFEELWNEFTPEIKCDDCDVFGCKAKLSCFVESYLDNRYLSEEGKYLNWIRKMFLRTSEAKWDLREELNATKKLLSEERLKNMGLERQLV